jgi:hypothetical protein
MIGVSRSRGTSFTGRYPPGSFGRTTASESRDGMSAIGLEQPDSANAAYDNTTPAAMACVRVVQLRPNHLKPSPHSRHKPANRNAAHFAAAQPIVTPNVTGLNKNLGYERNGSETPDFFATQHAIIELTANSRIVDLAR